jgi:hypothetical protein
MKKITKLTKYIWWRLQVLFNPNEQLGSTIMRKLVFMLCLVCVILFLPVAVSAVGNISVSSSPSGASVYLDGTSTGTTTPAKIESVASGSHIVLLRLTGYQDYTQSVIVSDNATSTVSATLTAALTTTTTEAITNGSIYIESNPSNAAVFLNTEYQGKTPVTLYNITHGDYRVVVQKTGYQDWSNRISVSLGTKTDVYATLSPEVTDTTLVTTIPTATLLKTTTTKKSTAKVPTPWPSATATPASPVSIPAILVAVGAGLIILRKR